MKTAEALEFLKSKGIENIGQLAVYRSLRDVAEIMESFAKERAVEYGEWRKEKEKYANPEMLYDEFINSEK